MIMKRNNVMIFTKRLVIAGTSVLLALYASGAFNYRRVPQLVKPVKLVIYDNYRDHVLNNYGIPFLQSCITSLYRFYIKLTLLNLLLFSVKYFPSGIYLYKFVKSVYRSSRERQKVNQTELEDLVLEIAMVKTKQVVRETECMELLAQQEREARRLRDMRAHVHDLITGSDDMRKLVENFAVEKPNCLSHPSNEEFNLMDFLAHSKNGPDRQHSEGVKDKGVEDDNDHVSESEKSEYSSVNEAEVEKDCQIKIIEVTNVYKVAYLKHYIKQKRIRQASKHALLKKKMATMKKLLESWQKSLNLVMKDHQYILRRDIGTSEDVSASCANDSDTDTAIDDISADWDQPYTYYREPEITECTDDYPCQEYNGHYYENGYEEIEREQEMIGEGNGQGERALLPRLVEETSSQMLALHNIKPEHTN